MLNPHTKIIHTISTPDYVEITCLLEGEDSANSPLRLLISPHKRHINVHFSHLGEKRVEKVESGANSADIMFG